MDLGNLKVTVGADTRELSTGLGKADRQVKQFAATVQKNTAQVKGNAVAYQNWGRVLQDLPYGFTGIQNNLTQLIPSIGALGLGFSALVAAVTFAQVGFGAWTRGMGGAKRDTDDFKESLSKLTEATAKESIQLRTNLLAIQDGNIPLGQRKQAIDELRGSYGEYLKHLSDEDILSGKVGDSLERINTALKAKLMLQLLQEKIVPIMKEQLELQLQNEEAAKKFAFADTESFKTQFKNRKDLKDAERNFLLQSQIGANKARAEFDKNSKAIAESEKKIQSLIATAKPLLEQSFGLDYKPEKGGKTFLDIIKELRKEVAGIQEQFKGGFINAVQLDQKVIDAYKKAVGQLGEIKADPLKIKEISLEVAPEQLREQMREFGEFIKKISKDESIPVPLEVKPVVTMTDAQASLANLGKQISRKLKNKEAKEFGIKFSDFISDEGLQEKIDLAKVKFDGLKAHLGQIVTDMKANVLSGIGEAIGAAISGGDLKGVFGGIMKTVADGLEQMGKAMIIYGLGIEAMKNAIKNPYLSIAAGIGLVAFSTALRAQVPKFAKGGMVTGATLAMVGDNPSGKEAIIPFERMGEFVKGLNLGGNSGSERLVAEMDMDKLRWVLVRNENRYGKNR